jgi:DNA-binding LacI/PurR family transcriptional regulator
MTEISLTDQVVRHVTEHIRSGHFAEGTVLPPVATLARTVKCSPETVKRALRRLAQAGVIKGIQRRGTMVLRRPSLGLVCLLLSPDEHTNILFQQRVCNALFAADYDVDVVAGGQAPARTRAWFQRVLSGGRGPAGLVTLGADYVTGEAATECADVMARFPRRVCYSLDSTAPADPGAVNWVTTDPQAQAKLVVQHLLQLGHRRIAAFAEHVPGRYDRSVTAQAARYCQDLLDVAGGQFFPFYAATGMEGLIRLIREQGATAYWDLNDSRGVCTLNHFYRAGLRVPEDVSVVGRNDTPWSLQAVPPLTSVSLNPDGVAAAVARVLTAPAADRQPVILIEPKLMVRGSTGPCPAAAAGRQP